MTRLKLDTGLLKTLLTASILGGIIHICVTFAIPHVASNDAYSRLATRLSLNTMVLLPPATPSAQLWPFQLPDQHIALCLYDASRGPVTIKASLPTKGWTLALYTPAGDNFYIAPGTADRRIDVSAQLIASSDRFIAVSPDRRMAAGLQTEIRLPAPQGLLVIRAPIKGQAYRNEPLRELQAATCSARRA